MNKTRSQIGKENRRNGAVFERKVRSYFEKHKFVISKWQNNVDLDKQKVVAAKSNRFLMRTTGFPDFIAYIPVSEGLHRVLGVEVKLNGKLNKTERMKCQFLLDNKVFSDVLIATQDLNGIKLIRFEEYAHSLSKKR